MDQKTISNWQDDFSKNSVAEEILKWSGFDPPYIMSGNNKIKHQAQSITQEEIAEAVGVDHATVSRFVKVSMSNFAQNSPFPNQVTSRRFITYGGFWKMNEQSISKRCPYCQIYSGQYHAPWRPFRKSGMTLEAIAEKDGTASHETVRQELSTFKNLKVEIPKKVEGKMARGAQRSIRKRPFTYPPRRQRRLTRFRVSSDERWKQIVVRRRCDNGPS